MILPQANLVDRQNGTLDYLVSHGKSGAVGRFTPTDALTLARGERVVLETQRGLEVGMVLRVANPDHRQFWRDMPPGKLLRRMTTDDEQALQRLNARAQELFAQSRRLAREMNVPVEIVDADILLDGRHAVLQYLGSSHWETEPYVKALSCDREMTVLLENLAAPAESGRDAEETQGGCGQPNCGRASGGCSSCDTGGGCSSCGSGRVDMRAYFAHLRSRMEETQRTPLL